MTRTNETKKIKIDCPKCDGDGKIAGCGHIANGDCFMCGGRGSLWVKPGDERIYTPTAAVLKKVEWIEKATDEQIRRLSWRQIFASRDFVHSGFGFEKAFPHIRDLWFEKFNARFCELQDERLAASPWA